MTQRAPFNVNVRELDKGLRKLERKVSKVAPQKTKVAAQRALNLTAKKGSTEVRRELARAKGVPQNRITKVVRPFNASLKLPKLESRVWIGLKRGIPFENLPARAAKKRLSKPFRVKFRSGHVGEARRILPSTHSKTERSHNLPIDHKLRLNPEAKQILKREAPAIAQKVFKPEYIRQLKLALKKLNSARRN